MTTAEAPNDGVIVGDDSTTAVTDTGTNVGRNAIITLLLIIIFCGTLLVNIVFILVFAVTRRIRILPNYLLVSIAVADILSAIFWILPAMVTAPTWTWLLGNGFCQFVGFMGTTCYALNVFTLLAVAFEKFMLVWFPSRHRLAFQRTITLILVFSLWLFACVFGLFPLVGWGEIQHLEPRFHCNIDYGKSYSLINFMAITAYILPLIACLVLFILVFVKIRRSQRNLTLTGQVILEDRDDKPGISYADRLKLLEEKYKNVAMKKKKPKLKKDKRKRRRRRSASRQPRAADDGYQTDDDERRNRKHSDSDSDFTSDSDLDALSSDDDEFYLDYTDGIRRKQERARLRAAQRLFKLQQRNMAITRTVAIVWAVYALLWLPYFVLNYVWIYEHYPHYRPEGAHTFVMIVAFFSPIYKPLIYLTNGYLRKAAKKAYVKHRKGGKRQTTRTSRSEETTVQTSRPPTSAWAEEQV